MTNMATRAANPTQGMSTCGIVAPFLIGPRFGATGPPGPTMRSPLARDANTARGLWQLSEELTETVFGL